QVRWRAASRLSMRVALDRSSTALCWRQGRDERMGSSGRTKEWTKVKKGPEIGLDSAPAHIIPIAHAVPPPNYQSRFRALVLFGRRPIECAIGFAITGPKTYTNSDIRGPRLCVAHSQGLRHGGPGARPGAAESPL